jgi:nitrite reductase/ring-hydroxylating ferredoxin subunit
VALPVQKLVSRCVKPRAVRNTLRGTNLGPPLHPVLTDLPIGTWTAAAVLDLLGGRRAGPAADLLVGAGIAAAVPTALSGLNDWSDTYGSETRVGLVHASANTVALSLYITSLTARRLGRRGAGRALGFGGLAVLVVGGYLGGHLSFVRGVDGNRTAFEERPEDWTPVAADSDLGEGAALRVDAAGASVLLHRDDGRIHALANTCSHMGGPLDEGSFADGCVTCPLHGSVFRLADGTIVRGTASTPQPVYETRVRDGQIEVRAAASSE